MNVKYLKLVDGSDVVCEIDVVSNDNSLTLIEPVTFIPIPNETGRVGISMVEWPMPGSMLSAESKYTIKTSHILFMTEPSEQVLNKYRESRTGIVTPTKSLIMPE